MNFEPTSLLLRVCNYCFLVSENVKQLSCKILNQWKSRVIFCSSEVAIALSSG